MITPIVSASEPILLVGGGDVDNAALRSALSRYRVTVAADSGADAVLAAGGVPHAVIGDMDSVSEAAQAHLPGDIMHRVAEQDSTDFEKCLARIEAPLVVAMGFLGHRVDHQLAVFTGLARRKRQRCLLLGAQDAVTLCPPEIALDVAAGTRVSLWPLAEVRGRSEGLHWPIEGVGRAMKRRGGAIRYQNWRAGRAQFEARSGEGEVGRALAAVAAGLEVKGDLLIVGKTGEARTLDCRDVHEHVLAAALGCDEAEAFGGVEPLNGASCHDSIPYCFRCPQKRGSPAKSRLYR